MIIQRTWVAMRMAYIKSNTKGKERIVPPQFERVYVTPDELQYKIAVTRRGIFGLRTLLPRGVNVYDLVKPETLRQLSVALEREVWCPQLSVDHFDGQWHNGAWVVVNRLGMPNGLPAQINYARLMARFPDNDRARIPLPLGVKPGRRINWLQLDSPLGCHVLISGITGSGKSTAIRAILAAITQTQSPRDIRYLLVDLKRQGDFAPFLSAPHIIAGPDEPIVGEVDQLLTVMRGLYAELKKRQRIISAHGYNIAQYNAHVDADQHMPRIVCVIDEYAAIRLERKVAAEIDRLVILIGQQGRSSGIHLIIGVQQTTGTIMPPEVRYNMTTQIVGRQATAGAAQSATGDRQALKIAEVPGRMMCYHGHRSYMVQMAMIEEGEVVEIVAAAATAYDRPEFQMFGAMVAKEVRASAPEPVRITKPRGLPDDKTLQPTAIEMVVAATLEQGGTFNTQKAFDAIKPALSHQVVVETIKKLVADGFVVHEGKRYNIGRIGKRGHALRLADASAADAAD